MLSMPGLGLPLPPLNALPASAHPIHATLWFERRKPMSNQVYRLMERHQQLDDRLRRVLTRRWADPTEVVRLKKLKLAIKDRLNRLMHRSGAPG